MDTQPLCEFSRIKIVMEYKPHSFPNIQASYEQKKAIFSIESGKMIDVLNGDFDDFPYKERCLVTGWITIHKDTLMQNWKKLEKDPNCALTYMRPLQ